jgi:hypothetical protein
MGIKIPPLPPTNPNPEPPPECPGIILEMWQHDYIEAFEDLCANPGCESLCLARFSPMIYLPLVGCAVCNWIWYAYTSCICTYYPDYDLVGIDCYYVYNGCEE